MTSRVGRYLTMLCLAPALFHCRTLGASQQKVRTQISNTPNLTLIRQTDLYNVYFDEVIKRCILHSAYFGEGTNAAAAGIGIESFECDPKTFSPLPEEKSQT